tara:strand:- start:2827 stop:3210 length:384 start_codon:yes stop_codon:yes gene_type:complete
MAVEYGFAFVSGQSVLGNNKTVQFKTGESETSGDDKFKYDSSQASLSLDGTLVVDSSSTTSKMALQVKNNGRVAGALGLDGNRRLIDYAESMPSNCVGEVYGPITIDTNGSLAIGENSHLVIKAWPY